MVEPGQLSCSIRASPRAPPTCSLTLQGPQMVRLPGVLGALGGWRPPSHQSSSSGAGKEAKPGPGICNTAPGAWEAGPGVERRQKRAQPRLLMLGEPDCKPPVLLQWQVSASHPPSWDSAKALQPRSLLQPQSLALGALLGAWGWGACPPRAAVSQPTRVPRASIPLSSFEPS